MIKKYWDEETKSWWDKKDKKIIIVFELSQNNTSANMVVDLPDKNLFQNPEGMLIQKIKCGLSATFVVKVEHKKWIISIDFQLGL